MPNTIPQDEWLAMSPTERASKLKSLAESKPLVQICEECGDDIPFNCYVDNSLPDKVFCSASHVFLYKDAMSARAVSSEASNKQAQIPTQRLLPETPEPRRFTLYHCTESEITLMARFRKLPIKQQILIQNLMGYLCGDIPSD